MDEHGQGIRGNEQPTLTEAAAPRRTVPGPRWLWAVAAAVLLVAVVSGLTQAMLARADARLARLQQAEIATATAPRYTYGLNALAVVAPDDVWVFGSKSQTNMAIFPGSPTPGQDTTCVTCGFALHFDGHAWRRAPTQGPSAAIITDVAMTSADEGWAVAFSRNGNNELLHYTGGAWRSEYQITTDATHHGTLRGVAMASASAGWAVGSQSDPATGRDAPLLLRFAQGAWTPVVVPELGYQTVFMRAVAALPSGEAWAVGTGYDGTGEHAIALHCVAGKVQVSEMGQRGSLLAVAAVGPGEAWAVGAETGVGPGTIMHSLGGKWAKVPSPTPNILHAIAMRTAADGWIGGDGAVTLHFDGRQWAKTGLVIHGFEINDIAAASPTEAWAVGANITSQDPNNLTSLLRFSNGEWATFPLDLPSLAA